MSDSNETKKIGGIPFDRKKYTIHKTEEDRKRAIRESQKRYYLRNRKRVLQRSSARRREVLENLKKKDYMYNTMWKDKDMLVKKDGKWVDCDGNVYFVILSQPDLTL